MNERWGRVPQKDHEEGEYSPWMNYCWLDTKTNEFMFTTDDAGVVMDPNQSILYEKLFLLFNDQAEYYAVCDNCHALYRSMQWSGSTQGPNWRETSQQFLEWRMKNRPWCQFCDPIFGNGGWDLSRS